GCRIRDAGTGIRLAPNSGAAPVPAPPVGGGRTGCVAGAVHRLLHGAVAAAVLLLRPRLRRAAAASECPTLVGHQRTWPGSAGSDLAGHAEVNADRVMWGHHLHRHRGDGGFDLGLFRWLARPGADVVRRPHAGGARLSAD